MNAPHLALILERFLLPLSCSLQERLSACKPIQSNESKHSRQALFPVISRKVQQLDMCTDSEFLEPIEEAVGADPSISRSGDPSATIDIEDMEEEEIGKSSFLCSQHGINCSS